MADLTTTLLQAGIDASLIDIYGTGFQRVPTDDKPHRKNGAVVVLSVRPLRVWFKNHGTDVTGVYTEEFGSGLRSRADFSRMMHERRQARVEREASQTEAAKRAKVLWKSARCADPNHPYLSRKKVGAHSIRQLDDNLVIPLRVASDMQSLQFISPEGDKKFLYGGRVSGCNHGIGVPSNPLIICEGYATAATLHEVLQLGVAIAFNAGNLTRVAIELQRRYPNSQIVIAADNDTCTVGNPGLRYATEAASAVNGRYIAPRFGTTNSAEPLTDWNDYANRFGVGALLTCFAEVRDAG